ncbi:CRISPR-associated protein Csx17 [Desulfomicrobium apsheronum]|uniref:CRISPR-associated protein Csx17 n=1 Tax=Desulfomicrobium apsheronum TaxID=52560 RepID=A0A1I3WEX5_9BACT|nr:type I-U CRISPR-associated protein Csx17 [Desulfomicrobium apsheronum]SFK06055.1 CRISPR-associated protein Csx17 [Desulfomicrobium apsheronum]
MIHVYKLDGCAPTPLINYLKALGILRLLAEQLDINVRGWWVGNCFSISTTFDMNAIISFFREKYEPTPIFNPWGGRSGFYNGSSEKSAREVLDSIVASDSPRFETYRNTIILIQKIIRDVAGEQKPKDELKGKFILSLRNSVRGKSILWMDTVSSIVGSGDRIDIMHPAIFGTGGNEGSGSYTSAYMAAIKKCILDPKLDASLEQVLFGHNLCNSSWDQNVGQFVPEGIINPWDILLSFEGACLIRSGITSRNTTDSVRWMSSPFYISGSAYGYAGESRIDEIKMNKGKELPGNGEQWFPLWPSPMTYQELAHIFVEGRAASKRRRADDGWAMVRAITDRGIRQGISEFIRYGYLQRNNLATHFAVPLGRYRVPEKHLPILACTDDLEKNNWISKLRKNAHQKKAASRLLQIEQNLGHKLFDLSARPSDPSLWQQVLIAMTDLETVMATGNGFHSGPIPPLRPEWVSAANDNSPEFRLALAFALQGSFQNSSSNFDGVRRHWLPLKTQTRFATNGDTMNPRLDKKPDVVAFGRDAVDDAIAVMKRRMVESAQNGGRLFPLIPTRGASAQPADLCRVLAGEVDLQRTMLLARAFMALDLRMWNAFHPSISMFPLDYPSDTWLAIRVAHSPWVLPNGQVVGADPAIIRRLESGDATSAFSIAQRRLRAAGVHTIAQFATVSPQTARLWAAALAFPVSKNYLANFVSRIDPNTSSDKEYMS